VFWSTDLENCVDIVLCQDNLVLGIKTGISDMVYLHFPTNLTEEELMLQTKYAKLKKKVSYIFINICSKYESKV
jgi:hypothetical protein